MSGPNGSHDHADVRVIVTTYGNDLFYLGPLITLISQTAAAKMKKDANGMDVISHPPRRNYFATREFSEQENASLP